MASKSTLFKLTHFMLIAGALLMMLVALLAALGEGVLLFGLFSLDHLGIPAVITDPDIVSDVGIITRETIFAVAIPLAALLVGGAVMIALIFQQTAKIVETAILGDPFAGENATRLSRIGWLLLVLQVSGTTGALLAQLMIPSLSHHVGNGHQLEMGHIDLDLGPQLSLIGLLAVLLIFVLAQVFKRGAEMRAELEATV